MKDRIEILRAAVPPKKNNETDQRSQERPGDPGGFKPEIALAAAGNELKKSERHDEQKRACDIGVGFLFATEQVTGGNEFPDHKSADRQKRKVDQKRIVPMQLVVNPSHGDRIGNLEDKEQAVEICDRSNPRCAGKHESGENDGANEKRTTSESHDES